MTERGEARARRSYVLALSRMGTLDVRQRDAVRRLRLAEVVYLVNDLGINLGVSAPDRPEWVATFLRDAAGECDAMVARQTESNRRAAENRRGQNASTER